MTFKETVDFLYSMLPAYHRIGKAAYKADLSVTLALDDHFGHPHRKFKSVHVAGTNGKGSVSHMLASILQCSGYKTGLYTSPHLKDFRERIRVNGKMIEEEAVVRFVDANLHIIEELRPSFFELTVALAFECFASEKVDVAVIETGLGGRLDSTNIVNPVLSVITNIGHDHMDLLGDTLGKVAIEKAGIIKPGIPVIIGETQEEVSDVFVSTAGMNNSEVIFADKVYKCKAAPFDPLSASREFNVVLPGQPEPLRIESPLPGNYQEKNILTVVAAALKLAESFPGITRQTIGEGISAVAEKTGFAGRWQILRREPLTICDTGHNKEGIEFVTGQLSEIKKGEIHFVIGFVSDKDLGSVLPLFPPDARYYFTRPSVQRGLSEIVLKETGLKYGLKGESFPSVKEALRSAERMAKGNDIIFIGGSTFVVADAL